MPRPYGQSRVHDRADHEMRDQEEWTMSVPACFYFFDIIRVTRRDSRSRQTKEIVNMFSVCWSLSVWERGEDKAESKSGGQRHNFTKVAQSLSRKSEMHMNVIHWHGRAEQIISAVSLILSGATRLRIFKCKSQRRTASINNVPDWYWCAPQRRPSSHARKWRSASILCTMRCLASNL